MAEKKTFDINPLRTIALTVAAIGAAGSLYFMFKAGHNQKSILLLTLFMGWVLCPFAAFFVADKISILSAARSRSILYWLMIILTIASLVAYSGTLMPPKAKLTFLFLFVPLISLLLIIITMFAFRKSGHD